MTYALCLLLGGATYVLWSFVERFPPTSISRLLPAYRTRSIPSISCSASWELSPQILRTSLVFTFYNFTWELGVADLEKGCTFRAIQTRGK